MALSWFKKVKQFKSPLAIVAAFLLRSRETLAKKVKAKTQEIQELKKELEQKDRILCEKRQQMEEDALKIAHLTIENQQLRQQPPHPSRGSAPPAPQLRTQDDFTVR